MLETETVSKTLKHSLILTWLIAWEDFIAFSHPESFNSYVGVYLRDYMA
jgi:hypothetical protein